MDNSLFSVPYLLDTIEQDRGLSLMVLVKTRLKIDSYQFKKSPSFVSESLDSGSLQLNPSLVFQAQLNRA